MCKNELTTGIHNPPDEFPWLLTEAYYHKPEQLKSEFVNQDLTYLNTYAIEGISWLDKDFFTNMLNDKKRKTLIELLQITENDSCTLAFSPHMMIAVKNKTMKNKDRYFKALEENQGQLNEIDLGEKIQIDENETREIIAQLLFEYKIRYDNKRVCKYLIVNKKSR
ncbi:hypothetical protein [Maribacter sp.]|uniref:hypothetical protein n=1 Tax=Maribacter sp. TaxID=1897614 RepID=UPI00329A44EE